MRKIKIPQQLERGSSGQIQARQLERVRIMESSYPGVKFSHCTFNKFAASQFPEVPGLGELRAIFNQACKDNVTPDNIKLVTESAIKWGYYKSGSGYVSYTTIHMDTGLTYQIIFSVINKLKSDNPYLVSFSVDRLGKNTFVKIDKKASF